MASVVSYGIALDVSGSGGLGMFRTTHQGKPLDFGRVRAGHHADPDRDFVIKNTTKSTLPLTIEWKVHDAAFRYLGSKKQKTNTISLGPRQEKRVTFRFEPRINGKHYAIVELHSDYAFAGTVLIGECFRGEPLK